MQHACQHTPFGSDACDRCAVYPLVEVRHATTVSSDHKSRSIFSKLSSNISAIKVRCNVSDEFGQALLRLMVGV